MLSDAALAVLKIAKAAFDDGEGPKSKVTYEMDFRDPRTGEVISTMKFKLGNPISEEKADQIITEMLPLVSTVLGDRITTRMAATLLDNQGIVKRIKEDVDSTFEASFVDAPTDDALVGASGAIRTAAGRFASQLNLKAALELLMKENIMKTMTSPHAGTGLDSPLKNRTGRFLNSAEIPNIAVTGSDKDHISIYYRYMVYPYQVFDPKNTRSPNTGLASHMRNPQRIIGEALKSAAGRLLSKKYKVTIRQIN